jgi:glucosamine-6-phosphate deaminase
LAQLAALRFLEWAAENPEGVVALPTGEIVAPFVRWLFHYRNSWRQELRDPLVAALGRSECPELQGLRVVQALEFFPVDPQSPLSQSHILRTRFLQPLGIDPARALLWNGWHLGGHPRLRDLSDVGQLFGAEGVDFQRLNETGATHAQRQQHEALVEMVHRAEAFESRLREWGGIGCFVGSVGPGGHLAGNPCESSHHSTTRLTEMDWPLVSLAAHDLGGVSMVRRKLLFTLGLATLRHRPDLLALLLASGEESAGAVKRAVSQPPSPSSPLSSMQGMPHARLLVTGGAASQLWHRRHASLARSVAPDPVEMDKLLLEGALALGQRLDQLEEAWASPELQAAARLAGKPLQQMGAEAHQRLLAKIRRGLEVPTGKRFLHTAPHHDDIELAYFPYIHHLARHADKLQHFCYMTPGFHSVTDAYLAERLAELRRAVVSGSLFERYPHESLLEPVRRQEEIASFLWGVASMDSLRQATATSYRLYRLFCDNYALASAEEFLDFLERLDRGELPPHIGKIPELRPDQLAKSWLRQWEAELVWGHLGFPVEQVDHLMLRFYSSPDSEEADRLDAQSILTKLEEVRPDVVTVAMDPQDSGPVSHFRTLMAVDAGLQLYVEQHGSEGLEIWGYRNVWTRYHFSEVECLIPISLNAYGVVQHMFRACFGSQREAEFPSAQTAGDFAEVAQRIWSKQHQSLVKLLGRDTFYRSEDAMLRRAYGAICLDKMNWAQFRQRMAGYHRIHMESRRIVSPSM